MSDYLSKAAFAYVTGLIIGVSIGTIFGIGLILYVYTNGAAL